MLKLVNIFEMDYNSIVQYRLSFKKFNEMSYSLYMARYGNEKDYYVWRNYDALES